MDTPPTKPDPTKPSPKPKPEITPFSQSLVDAGILTSDERGELAVFSRGVSRDNAEAGIRQKLGGAWLPKIVSRIVAALIKEFVK